MKRLTGIVGQTLALRQLEAEGRAGRLAHAYLFAGPRGVGRASTAKALFQAIVCRGPGDAVCGQCPDCRRLQAGHHEDFLTLAPPTDQASAQIKVDDLREMLKALSFPPLGSLRLVLIREAQALNLAAANALLKTLEEPPPGNMVILTVQDPAELLPTLVSRSRRVNFLPLSRQDVVEQLQARGYTADQALSAAGLAGGSLGRALSLDYEQLTVTLAGLLAALKQNQAKPSLPQSWALSEELAAPFRGGERLDRQGLVEILDLLALYYRDQAVCRAGRPEETFLPPADYPAVLSLSQAVQSFSHVRQAQNQILMNAAPELALSVLWQNLAAAGGDMA